MHIIIDGKPVTLTPWQLEKACREQTRLNLEEKASQLLANHLGNSANVDETTPSPMAIHAPWHIDYLSDQVVERFLRSRRDTATDASTWRRAITQVLASRQKSFAQIPEFSEYGPWLLRPFESLLRLMWRCQYTMDEVEFCLDESVEGELQMPFHVSFSCNDGLLYIHMASPHSRLIHLLDDGTQRQYSFEEFAQAVRELLEEDLWHMGRKFPKFFWVHK